MREKPNAQVLNWVDQQYIETLYISAITIAEIRLGIALLPDGKRKTNLSLAATETMKDFSNNCMDFDGGSAEKYAEVVAHCTKQGRPISVEDAQIASVALVNNAVLVTRNISDFEVIPGLNSLILGDKCIDLSWLHTC